MKVLLFQGQSQTPFPLSLKIKYLQEIGVRCWIYFYEEEKDRFIHVPHRDKKKYPMYEWNAFVSTEDLGEVIPDAFGDPHRFPGAFLPKKDDYRFNRDMIDIVEREKDLFYHIEVVEVRKGDKFRILMDYDLMRETIELEKEVKWIEAS